MSSWLNINESLNSIKGQITTFASNVLADDEGTDEVDTQNEEEFKNICIQKDLEIERLKKLNEELQKSSVIPGHQNGEPNDNNWDWTTPELTVEDKDPKTNISNLKEVIKALENEKNDLLNQLEQLDLENQQNLAELVGIREKLQNENNELKDKNVQLKKQLSSREEKLKKEFINKPNDSELKMKLDDTTKELTVLKTTHETLKKALEDTQRSGEKELAELTNKFQKSELENKIIYNELQQANEFNKSAELKSQEDAENCQKLAFILESYEKQVSLLKEELANAKDENNTRDINNLEKSCLELQSQLDHSLKLKDDFEKLQLESQQMTGQLKRDLEEKTQEITCLKEKLNRNTGHSEIILENQEEVFKLKEQKETLKNIAQETIQEKESMHNIYVNIITDNIKRYIDSALLPSEHSYETSENPQITEFSKQVENIFKILLEFKQKCETLEKELIKTSNKKTEILTGKYNEIEKLIQNSDVLSQELIKKGETIKELESEIANLITNNDVLLSELDSYKNSGLQTISESNEDNMVLLETDLENANQRIKELEGIIDSPNKTPSSRDTSSASLEDKVNQKQEDYQELLNSFDDMKLDFDEVTYKLKKANDKLTAVASENEDLRTHLEKVRTDFENTDYQLSEANFTIDSLKEELDVRNFTSEAYIRENKELKLQNMNSIDIKSELNEVKEKWLTEENRRRELETLVRNLTEKQQSSKMTETSLKLQYDTLNKEHFAMAEAKHNLEQSLANAKTNIAAYEDKYTELLQNYDLILLRCENLNTILHEKENELLRIKDLEEQNKLEKMAKESTDDEAVSKLNEQLHKKDEEVKEVTGNLKDMETQKTELEQLIINQKQEVANIKESLNNLESQISTKDDEIVQLKDHVDKIQQDNAKLKYDLDKAIKDISDVRQPTDASIQTVETFEETNSLKQDNEKFQEEIVNLQAALKQSQENVALLQQQFQELAISRNELINMVTIKHQESLNYHNEIQRLSEILKSETDKYMQLEAKLVEAGGANNEIAKKNEIIDKLTDKNTFLKEKCDVLTKNLLEEQSKLQQLLAEKSGPSEKEVSLSKQLERLQSHLMELEEHYTQELLQAEQKNATLQAKLTDLEQREKNSSTMYTSVSIRANQQVETLQSQLQTLTTQREDLRKKISDAEDLNNKQAAALANLQFVLEQFQKDKEKDVLKETERIRRQINAEKQVQDDLKKEIDGLKVQLEESKIGLQAASRLSNQLELLKKQNSGLKEEVSQLQQKLSKSQQTIYDLTSQTDGKIDKSLIKSLVLGFLSSSNTSNWNKDQTQVLKLIATVLDFNQQDHDKVKLNKSQQGSWLGSILFPQANNQNMSQESLSQAFVKFLEKESRPRVVPSLLGEQSNRPSTSAESSKRNTPRASPSPIILNEVVLPTFADFGQSRNSSSILKDVLKDNNS